MVVNGPLAARSSLECWIVATEWKLVVECWPTWKKLSNRTALFLRTKTLALLVVVVLRGIES